jgi:hypothetical protein
MVVGCAERDISNSALGDLPELYTLETLLLQSCYHNNRITPSTFSHLNGTRIESAYYCFFCTRFGCPHELSSSTGTCLVLWSSDTQRKTLVGVKTQVLVLVEYYSTSYLGRTLNFHRLVSFPTVDSSIDLIVLDGPARPMAIAVIVPTDIVQNNRPRVFQNTIGAPPWGAGYQRFWHTAYSKYSSDSHKRWPPFPFWRDESLVAVW